MLIPHGRGGTRTLTVCNLHFWTVAAVLVSLSFTASFFYQRNAELSQRADLLRQANRALELENARVQTVPAAPSGPSRDEIRQVETRLRAEYEASISAITAELSELYDMETRARNITGLAPRKPQPMVAPSVAVSGKGGGPGSAGLAMAGPQSEGFQPPYVIYGMARPSADLIVQEIRLRTQSLGDLVTDMGAHLDRIERMPAGWPVARGQGRITSTFGHRLDPFTRRVSRHNAVDISAKHGSPIVATAKGVVREAQYANYFGNMVVIDHGNGVRTLYAHLSSIGVKPGQIVSRGEVIGRLGSTGRSTGPHIHYEVHVNGRPVNPAQYLSK